MKSMNKFTDSKPHYDLLDGLRGVAALLVVWYHVFEGYQFAGGKAIIDFANHGYLAVDFFFILSGFVIGYAYDSRWSTGLTIGSFFKRRLIRLHPMVIMGVIIGAVGFATEGFTRWDGSATPLSMVMLCMLTSMFMIPAVPGAAHEVRGNGEMFPLNGPTWSLFFEYIGNIIYALVLRRLSTGILKVLTAIIGVALAVYALTDAAGYGCIGVGWTLDTANFTGGLLRMLFPFTLGTLIARIFKPLKHAKGAFWVCSLLLVAIFHVPYIAGTSPVSLNGLFEMACIAIVFPCLLWLGASGKTTDAFSQRICSFLGRISFPLYMVHYPIMYSFYKWLIRTEQYSFGETWPVALCVLAASILLAYLCLVLYETPVRNLLTRKFNSKKI